MNRIRKFKISFITILITFGVGISAWILYNSALFQPTKLEIPDARWEKIVFQSINDVTTLAKLDKLREKNLAKDDVEIRVWRGSGLGDLEGMIFRKVDEIWIAYYVRSNDYAQPTKAKLTQLYGMPKSGWESFTKQLFDAGVLTLPDASKTSCDPTDFLDGTGYVVEIYKDKVYRTYMYHSGNEEQCKEGKQMIKIAKLIAQEFYNRIDKCEKTEWLPCLSRDTE